MSTTDEEDRSDDQQAKKKPYARPKVRDYGDVRALTQSGSGKAQDKVGGSGKGFMTGA